MTWRVWIAIAVGVVVFGAGTWAASAAITESRPVLGEVVTITPAPSTTHPPSPTHPAAPTDEAAEAPLEEPPAAGDDDDEDDADEPQDIDEPDSGSSVGQEKADDS